MGRKRRFDFPWAWHHVMNRGVDRNLIFRNDFDRQLFMRELQRASSSHALELHGYCLMGNHFHLLVCSREGCLARGMHQLGTRYGQQFNSRHGRDGPVFRARYVAKVVMEDAQLVATLRYIHANPVGAGLVSNPADWPWSSAAAYQGRAAPAWGLVASAVLAMTADVGQFAPQAVPGTATVPGT